MRILENPDYRFVATRRRAYLVSGVLILLSLLSFATRGLELGIDFQGGTSFVLADMEGVEVTEVRSTLTSVLGAQPVVKTYGEDAIIVLTTVTGEIGELQARIVGGLQNAFGEAPEVLGSNAVGASFAEDLQEAAFYSVLGGLLVIFIYVLVRYEWRFSMGAVAALFHDVIITLGIFSLLHGFVPFSLQIDQAIIAAFLTIVGYSINDTVVVYDRIREYTSLFRTKPYEEIVNRAINSTLSRTVMTGASVLIALLVLFIFGGEVLRGFSFALIIGILIGTYSSVYIASPVAIELRALADKRKAAA